MITYRRASGYNALRGRLDLVPLQANTIVRTKTQALDDLERTLRALAFAQALDRALFSLAWRIARHSASDGSCTPPDFADTQSLFRKRRRRLSLPAAHWLCPREVFRLEVCDISRVPVGLECVGSDIGCHVVVVVVVMGHYARLKWRRDMDGVQPGRMGGGGGGLAVSCDECGACNFNKRARVVVPSPKQVASGC
jgi:hypothetical protein